MTDEFNFDDNPDIPDDDSGQDMPLPDWLSQADEFGARDPRASQEMSYEEWMAASEESEKEPDLSEEVPDWFQDEAAASDELPGLDDLTGAAASDSVDDAGYVPDWFMGLEEQSLDEAPDWVKDTDVVQGDTDSLLDTSAFEEPIEPFAFEDEGGVDDDVPDWFKASGEQADLFAAPDAPLDEDELGLPDLDFTEDISELSPEPVLDFDDSEVDLATMLDADLDESAQDVFNWTEEAQAADKRPDVFGGFELDEVAEPDLDFGDFGTDQDLEAAAAEDDLLAGWDDDSAVMAPSEPEPVEELGFDLGLGDDVADEDLSDIFGGEDFAGKSTRALIDEMQTSSFDISALLGDETVDEIPEEEDSGAALIVADDTSFAAEDDLFEDVDDTFFKTFTAPPATAEPTPVDASREVAPDDLLDLGEFDEEMLAEDETPITSEGIQPEWVADLRPDDLPVTLKAGNLEFEFEQARLSDMPEGLRALRERAAALSAIPEDEDTPATGPLAGIAGSLQSSDLVAETEPDLQIGTGVRITKDQQQQIAVLEAALELTRREQAAHRLGDVQPDAEVVPAKPRRQTRFKADRLLVSLVLLIVLVAPFISDGLHVDFIEEPQDYAFTSEQETFTEGIANLQAGDYVLLSFDYGPTVANELNPLAEAVLRDIIKQDAIPILTSVSPLGALNSRHVIDNLRDDKHMLQALQREERLQPREHYIELRYIAGEAVGVRALTRSESLAGLLFDRDVDGKKTGLEFDTLGDQEIAMVIVIAESLDDTRRWAEQLKDLDDLEKYLLTTSAVEPLVKTYVDVGGDLAYRGYLAGYRDTYIYNRVRNAEAVEPADNLDDYNLPETDIAQWYSVALGVLAAVVLVIAGAVIHSLRLVGRRRS